VLALQCQRLVHQRDDAVVMVDVGTSGLLGVSEREQYTPAARMTSKP
jgi:hypothetical protein